MSSLAIVLVALAAMPQFAQLEFTTVQIAPEIGRFCSENLAQHLSERGLQVTTAKQIAATLGVERQRQLLGCSESSGTCMAELASALGAPALILGEVARLGTRIQLNVRVMKASDTSIIATYSQTVAAEEALLDAVASASRSLTDQLRALYEPSAQRAWPLAPTLVSGGLAVGSGVLFALAFAAHTQLTSGPQLSLADAQLARDRGLFTQYGALGLIIAAGVTLVATTIWYWLSAPEPARSTP